MRARLTLRVFAVSIYGSFGRGALSLLRDLSRLVGRLDGLTAPTLRTSCLPALPGRTDPASRLGASP